MYHYYIANIIHSISLSAMVCLLILFVYDKHIISVLSFQIIGITAFFMYFLSMYVNRHSIKSFIKQMAIINKNPHVDRLLVTY